MVVHAFFPTKGNGVKFICSYHSFHRIIVVRKLCFHSFFILYVLIIFSGILEKNQTWSGKLARNNFARIRFDDLEKLPSIPGSYLRVFNFRLHVRPFSWFFIPFGVFIFEIHELYFLLFPVSLFFWTRRYYLSFRQLVWLLFYQII